MYPIPIPRHTDKLSLPATLDTTRSLTKLRTYPLAVAQPVGYASRDYHIARLALMGDVQRMADDCEWVREDSDDNYSENGSNTA